MERRHPPAVESCHEEAVRDGALLCARLLEVRRGEGRPGGPRHRVRGRHGARRPGRAGGARGRAGRAAQVPMLVDGDVAVWDRRRILADLDETYGTGPCEGRPSYCDMPSFVGGTCRVDWRGRLLTVDLRTGEAALGLLDGAWDGLLDPEGTSSPSMSAAWLRPIAEEALIDGLEPLVAVARDAAGRPTAGIARRWRAWVAAPRGCAWAPGWGTRAASTSPTCSRRRRRRPRRRGARGGARRGGRPGAARRPLGRWRRAGEPRARALGRAAAPGATPWCSMPPSPASSGRRRDVAYEVRARQSGAPR